MNMKKVIRLTESDLLRVVKKVISENNFEDHQRKVSDMLKRTKLDEVFKYIGPYLESGCVTYKNTRRFFSIDVDAADCFQDNGFDKLEGKKIKAKLREFGFQSVGVGEYMKQINMDI